MRMKGIKGKLVFNFSMIILTIVLILEGLFIFTVRQYYYGVATQALANRATTSTSFYNHYVEDYRLKDRAKSILENISQNEIAKVEIIDPQKNLLLDSYGFASLKQVDTPDVTAALSGKTGIWTGRNKETGERIIAVSNPLKAGEKVVGALRYTVSAEALDEVVGKVTLAAILIGLLVVIIFFAVSLMLANRIINPIRELTEIVGQMAKGSFTRRAVKRSDDEIGTLAETFNYMADELGETEKLKNDFISTISHELRTPLTSIKGWSETLLSGSLDDHEETIQGLEVIAKETERLGGLVEELLDFSKFHTGKMAIHRQPIDIKPLLEDIRHQYSSHARRRNIALYFRLQQGALMVNGDENRLKQVFVNLLDNAFKFTPEHGEIQVATEHRNREIRIVIADNGEGIPPENLPKVTEKFYKGSSKRPGSGLGLAICQEIIQLHGGGLIIESSPGLGTRVAVALPSLD
ncbi:sensor histidine kinase [Brevibacillus sp. B_LB10_24]|uniref:sensor histidine kinase n=1 Tax=Brevibacillus sp. B_LB10_24 TaxID=3380645 RepID=UPI0038BB67FE